MDATQAFNKVDHAKLIDKLIARGTPKYIINLLINWFDNQLFQIAWGKTQSKKFQVLQGVRQGGILSAFLFAFYIDDMSLALNRSGLGAKIGNRRINHTIYADDICLITTTAQAMARLLGICKDFADDHNLEFN